MRLTQRGRDAGVVCDERFAKFEDRRSKIDKGLSTLKSYELNTADWKKRGCVMTCCFTVKGVCAFA